MKSSLIVLLWICCSRASSVFHWDAANTNPMSVGNHFRVYDNWGLSFGKLCAHPIGVNDNAYIAPKAITGIDPVGSFQVTLSLGNDASWYAVTVLVGLWGSFALNDYYPADMTCNNRVCVLIGQSSMYQFSETLGALDIDRNASTITFAASWNFTDMPKRANQIKFFVNGTQLETNFPNNLTVLAPPRFHDFSHAFTVFCRKGCNICIDSMDIWNTELAFTSNAPLATMVLAVTPTPSTSIAVELSSTSAPAASPSLFELLSSSSIAPVITDTAGGATPVVVGAAVGGSLGFLFVLIGAGWLIFAFKKKKQQSEAPSSGQTNSEYGVLPPNAQIYDDIDDVRTSTRGP